MYKEGSVALKCPSFAKVQNCIDPELDSPGELWHERVSASYYRYAYNNLQYR